eukprot:GHVU01115180.1.p1 GENE.GHVU01115180.1~~GHVU01115180.1.p1  ORF type:complete len:153 (+),score=8.14 GHVU01115180.1:271-729(+)
MGQGAGQAPTDAASRANGAASEVPVGLQQPFTVLNASAEFLDLFRLSASTCIGRSLATTIAGPDTDSYRMVEMIVAARGGKESSTTIVLYPSTGEGASYHVRARRRWSCRRAGRDAVVPTLARGGATFLRALLFTVKKARLMSVVCGPVTSV